MGFPVHWLNGDEGSDTETEIDGDGYVIVGGKEEKVGTFQYMECKMFFIATGKMD